jgi:hypothetical protein
MNEENVVSTYTKECCSVIKNKIMGGWIKENDRGGKLKYDIFDILQEHL